MLDLSGKNEEFSMKKMVELSKLNCQSDFIEKRDPRGLESSKGPLLAVSINSERKDLSSSNSERKGGSSFEKKGSSLEKKKGSSFEKKGCSNSETKSSSSPHFLKMEGETNERKGGDKREEMPEVILVPQNPILTPLKSLLSPDHSKLSGSSPTTPKSPISWKKRSPRSPLKSRKKSKVATPSNPEQKLFQSNQEFTPVSFKETKEPSLLSPRSKLHPLNLQETNKNFVQSSSPPISDPLISPKRERRTESLVSPPPKLRPILVKKSHESSNGKGGQKTKANAPQNAQNNLRSK